MLSTGQALLKHATDAMKESRVHDFLTSVWSLIKQTFYIYLVLGYILLSFKWLMNFVQRHYVCFSLRLLIDGRRLHVPCMKYLSTNMQQLNIQEERQFDEPEEDIPSVVIPNHLQVQTADCSHLSFGSFSSRTLRWLRRYKRNWRMLEFRFRVLILHMWLQTILTCTFYIFTFFIIWLTMLSNNLFRTLERIWNTKESHYFVCVDI